TLGISAGPAACTGSASAMATGGASVRLAVDARTPGGLGLRPHGRQPAQREEAAMQGRRVWAHAAFLVAALSAGLVAGPAIVNAATRGSGASPEVIAATSQGVLASGNRTNVVLAACDEIGGVVLESGGTTLYTFQPDRARVRHEPGHRSIHNHLTATF